MSSFYNNSGGPGGNNTNSGFYNAGGGNPGGSIYGQQQQQQQQQGFSNMSQWQVPSSNAQQQQSQQGGQQPMMYGQSSQQQPGSQFFAGVQQQAAQVATETFTQFATGNLSGEKIGQQVIDRIGKGFGGGIPGLNHVMHALRGYYAVDNHYVKRKMVKVLFPFLSKHWKREELQGPEKVTFALPNTDENAPDLYLPVMSLVTYCLLCALCYGTAGKFNPEVIADVTTKCFLTQILEVLIIRFGFYMMDTSVALLDLFAYTGYKYLGLTVNMLFGIMFGFFEGFGRTGFYVTFFWTASAAAFFMLKTMANNIPRKTSATGPKREFMVIAFALSQFATMWLVSNTKFL